MSPILLYTVFHANLDFSALPDRDIPLVLDRCYWPLLRLVEETGLRLGLELPARTLERIQQEDPEWLKTLRSLAERAGIEIVGSGYAQLIGPLVPLDVNRSNLALGAERYRELLGHAPGTWFVNEQTYARGLAPLYAEIGASALVMEWNNPANRRPELRCLRARPARVAAGPTQSLSLLWNDCVTFQRLQRAAQGVLPLVDYLEGVARATKDPSARALCAYGGDLEIFDYRPGAAEPAGADQGTEWGRLGRALVTLARDPRFRFVLPRDAAITARSEATVELASAEEPIPCKKQPRYNPTRWAVSGRDGLGMNRSCFALRRGLRTARALEGRPPGAPLDGDDERLLSLWRSDLRTRATEEKHDAFHGERGELAARLEDRIAARAPALPQGWDAVLHNPWPRHWHEEPVEIDVVLEPGRCPDLRVGTISGTALPPEAAQVEVTDHHRDGTPRRVTVVLAPVLAPGETLRIRLDAAPRAHGASPAVRVTPEHVETEAVCVDFLPARGGAVAAARFRAIAAEPLVGTIPHGSFDAIEYTPDFYSGHVIAHSEDGAKLTSLLPADCIVADGSGSLRARLSFRVRAPFGDWRCHYRVYRDRPRIDVIHELDLRELRLRTLRLGVATWLPGAFERETLGYATVNGGEEIERFALAPGVRVEHPRSVSPAVTASSCLGATEGWVSAGDADRGVALIGDRQAAAVVPMVEFADVDESFLLRIHHSAAETDETRATFFRGRLRVPFAWVGHRSGLDAVRSTAHAVERSLVFRTAREVGIARTL